MQHIRIAHYRLHASTAHEVAAKAEGAGGLMDVFKGCTGFISYELADISNGEMITVSHWASREDADSATEATATWARDNIGEAVSTKHVYAGDVVASSRDIPA